MEQLKPYGRTFEFDHTDFTARPEARQDSREDVDDLIFAGESWSPSER